jgi:hypothetical protein
MPLRSTVRKETKRLKKQLHPEGLPACEVRPCNHFYTTEWAAAYVESRYLPPPLYLYRAVAEEALRDVEMGEKWMVNRIMEMVEEERVARFGEHFQLMWEGLQADEYHVPEDGVLKVRYVTLLKGKEPPPLCEGCPALRGRGRLYHLKIAHHRSREEERPVRKLPSIARKAPHILLAEQRAAQTTEAEPTEESAVAVATPEPEPQPQTAPQPNSIAAANQQRAERRAHEQELLKKMEH